MDLISNEKRLETEYPLDTFQGVSALLSNIHHVWVAAIDKSDFNAVNLLLDFKLALSRANVTARQHEAIHLVFFEDLTQKEAGERMGISQQAVHQLVKTVIESVATQYAKDLREIQGGVVVEEHSITTP